MIEYGERLEDGFNLLDEEYERPLPMDQTLWQSGNVQVIAEDADGTIEFLDLM